MTRPKIETQSAPDDGVALPGETERSRLTALMRLIDRAEREAMALSAPETGICLQLARTALLSRRDADNGQA